MKAIIRTIDPTGVPVDFQTDEMKLAQLLAVLPQIKDALTDGGYEILDGQPVAVQNLQSAPAPATSFAVSEISATVADGKVYWRVKGGEFQKWGVIVYSEVLDAAGLTERMNPLKPFAEGGWVATYTLKENGKPKKVTALRRA
jgi:hypothetical protein